jgi:hypothetical protein
MLSNKTERTIISGLQSSGLYTVKIVSRIYYEILVRTVKSVIGEVITNHGICW